MDPNLWMQPTLTDNQRPRSTPTNTVVDDWVKDRSITPGAGAGGSATGSASSPINIDINELLHLEPSYTSPFPSTSFTYAHSQPFNTLPYGSSSWSTRDPLPLSSYSSLNGATTSTSSSSSHSHQSSDIVIDPALTSANQPSRMPHQPSTSSSYPYSPYSYLSHYLPAQQQHSPPQQQQQQQQPQQQPQGTLSPQALHASSSSSSTSSLLGGIPPSHFYAAPQRHPQPVPTPSSSTHQQPPHLIQPNQPILQLAPTQLSQQPPQPPQTPQSQQPSQPPTPTPIQQASLLSSLKPLLQSHSFTGAGAVAHLAQKIADFPAQHVDASTRLEVLTKIRDGAGNHYFRAWGENPVALDVTREWLRGGYGALKDRKEREEKRAEEEKENELLGETVMPLLHIIDRLPLTVESLKNSKLGKLVVRIVKDPPTPAIKDMASNVERRWRQLVEGASSKSNSTGSSNTTNGSKETQDSKPPSKKRKDPPSSSTSSSTSTSRGAPPPKKAATALNSTKPSKTTTKVASAPPPKSDSSFFSAPKPKPKLPTFRKAAVPASTLTGHNNTTTINNANKDSEGIAQPSSIDPFQDILKSMGKSGALGRRSQSPAVVAANANRSTPPGTTPPTTAGTPTNMNAGKNVGKNGKKKKSVTWAPEGLLESVKLIEKAVYDDDEAELGLHHHSLRDLDRGEGAALHAHVFEEQVDWSEPLPIEIPIDIETPLRGESSVEKSTQEQREQSVLVAVYLNSTHIPESPSEPTTAPITEEEVDKDVCVMMCGPEVDAIFFSGEPVDHQYQGGMPGPGQGGDLASVADLVAQLATGNTGLNGVTSGSSSMGELASGVGEGGIGMMNGFNQADALGDPLAAIQQHMATLTPDQVQLLLQQLNPAAYPGGGGPGNSGPGSTHQDWSSGNGPFEYNNTAHHDEHSTGADRPWSDTGSGIGGRGGGRGGGRFGRGGRGRGGGTGEGGGFKHNKRKPCSFFQSGRCKYGDQCDFAHELIS